MPEELKNMVDQVEAVKAEILDRHKDKVAAEQQVAEAQQRAAAAVAARKDAIDRLVQLKAKFHTLVDTLYTPVDQPA